MIVWINYIFAQTVWPFFALPITSNNQTINHRYESLKSLVKSNTTVEAASIGFYLAAAIAFFASSIFTVPGELIKQRLQIGQLHNFAQGASSIWTEEGLRGFFWGYSGVCLCDVPYTLLQLGLYDQVKALYRNQKIPTQQRSMVEKNIDSLEITPIDEIFIAGLTGGITGYLTSPLDLLKTKLMTDTKKKRYEGLLDCLSKTIRDHGVGALFQGGIAQVLWLVPLTATYLPTYEATKRMLTGCRLETIKF